jgi:hypothetical protein
MKTLNKIFVVILLQCCFSIQMAFSTNNDLVLVKPLINFNYPDGGYYSEYYMSAFNYMYCGAIVKNVGVLNSTNVYLEIKFLDYSNNVIATYTSDTIASLLPNETDTLEIPQTISYINWFKISYQIKSDSIDENEINNNDTIPYTAFCGDMWSQVSRADNPTSTLNINQVINFQSGDFLGVTLKIPNGWHFLVSIGVYLTDYIPDSVTLIGKLYQNGLLVGIDSLLDPYSGNIPGWVYTQYDFSGNFIIEDSLYYFGFELKYPNGTNIPIGVDTSSFHNFETETIAKIGNTWTTLDFVPLIQLICDPEAILETANKNQVCVYPNPSSGTLYLNNVADSKIEIYDLVGKLIFTDFSNYTQKTINLSMVPPGNYIVRIINEQSVISKKITILK